MTIQVFLTALLLGVAMLVAAQRTTSRLVQIAVLVAIAAGCYFVWAPEQANVLAQAVGVGRGADLLFYLWVIITLALILFMYLKIQRLTRRVTRLTRAIALAHPQRPGESGDQT
jgi:hypothetical protein